MTDDSATPEPPVAPGGKSYQVGNIGPGARVAIGENITWIEGLAQYPGGDQLTEELNTLMSEISSDAKLPEADRALARNKAQAVAEALPNAAQEPQRLHTALLDAQVFLQARVAWAWERLRSALMSDTAQGIISGVTEATVRGAIKGLLGT